MSSPSSLEIIDQPIDQLQGSENSAHAHNRAQYTKVSALIKKFGPVIPLIVDPNGTIVDGVLRWQCLKDLGYETVPTVTIRTNNPADIRAIRLALNRIPLDAGWDKQKLRAELKYLIDVDYDLDLTGFDAPEIDAIIEIDNPSIAIVEGIDEAVTPQAPAVSKTGDIIVCGRHRLICGDGLDRTILSNLLAEIPVRLVMTDPVASGEMCDSEFIAFLTRYFETALTALADGALLFIWMDWRHIDALIAAAKTTGLSLVNICVWAKTAAGMGSLYRCQHEFCSVFKFGTAPHVNNVELGKHGRSRSNVWAARDMAGWGRDRDTLLSLRPTVKPVRLLADAILDTSKRGDIVLNSFLGSGSVLIACEDIGRRCFGVELDPLYVDVAVRRWQIATGKDAIFADTGEIFNERSGLVRKAGAIAAGTGGSETPSASPSTSTADPELQGNGHE